MKMTRAGFEALDNELRRLNEQLQNISVDTSEQESIEGVGTPYYPGLQYANQKRFEILHSINDINSKLCNVEIVDSLAESETAVASHDVVTVHMTFDDGEEADKEFYIVETAIEDPLEGVQTITISSPVGGAILGKEIGEHIIVRIPAGTVAIDILDIQKSSVR